MQTIHINARTLKASLFCAGKDEIRHYLNGVSIEACATETRAIATDGHRLTVMRESRENDVQGSVQFIIPRDAVESVKLTAKQMREQTCTITFDGKTGRIDAGSVSIGFTAIKERFPDYRRVIPHTYQPALAHINPQYVMDMEKAARMFSDFRGHFVASRVFQSGENAAIVQCESEDFLGVVMPYRVKETSPVPYEWAKRDIAVAAELKKTA